MHYGFALTAGSNYGADDYPEEARYQYELLDQDKLDDIINYTEISLYDIITTLRDWRKMDVVEFYNIHTNRVYIDNTFELKVDGTQLVSVAAHFHDTKLTIAREVSDETLEALELCLTKVKQARGMSLKELCERGEIIPLSIRRNKRHYKRKIIPVHSDARYEIGKDPNSLIGLRVVQLAMCDSCGEPYDTELMAQHKATIYCHLESQWQLLSPEHDHALDKRRDIHAIGLSKLSKYLVRVPIRYSYVVPQWIADAIEVYKNNYSNSMDLNEFLDKIAPDGNPNP